MIDDTVNSEIFARVLILRNSHIRVSRKLNSGAKSLCCLLMEVNHALVANFNVANMSFDAIRENKVLAKISGLTVLYNFSSFENSSGV